VDNILASILGVAVYAVPAILAITLHEAAHGYAALTFGDPTARDAGRLSLNPIRHVDPMGTIVLPAFLILTQAPFLFGWAKPVPVNFNRLRSPRADMVWVALAGPGMNIALALVSGVLLRAVPLDPGLIGTVVGAALQFSIFINVILAVFNMIPLPPLDGGRVAVGLLPIPLARALARTEKYGILLLLGVLIGLPWLGSAIGVDLNIFAGFILPIVDSVVDGIAFLTGADLN
jgi:Zn-dependent protease